ncbi:MAG: radical SAM protein [Acidobacteria bacterium]|nr:MAG: radical SAM protein [Acidobacteriota bacterium]MCE7959286.1 radical SAM protein [Acidobacteria bacterium ACB2]
MKRRELTLAGVHLGEPLAGPGTVHVDLVNACNAACVTCWDHSPLLSSPRPASWKGKRARAEDVDRLLDDLGTLGGLRSVILSGMGEPFVHPEIHAICESVKRRTLHLTVITNLLLADPGKVLSIGVDQLLIGVHAATAESYRAFHPGTGEAEWTRLLASLDRFAGAGKRFRHVQVICATNAHELPAMVRLAARYGAGGITFKLASLLDGTERVALSPEAREALVAEGIPSAREEASRLGVATNLDVLARQLSAGGARTAPIAETGCFMGYAYARVTVEGDVLYCCDTEVKVGSLASGARFSDLWLGPRWQDLRDRLRSGRYFEGCSRCGKYAQNVALGRAFEEAYGTRRLLQVTGRA